MYIFLGCQAVWGQGWEREIVYEDEPLLQESTIIGVIPTKDEGFLVYTAIEDVVEATINPFITKLDQEGNNLWQKIWSEHPVEGIHIVKQLQDNAFLLFTETSSNFLLRKIDGHGQTLWTKPFSSFPHVNDILEKENGELVFTGSHFGDSFVSLYSSHGDEIWTYLFPLNTSEDAFDGGYKIIETIEENLLIVGGAITTNDDAMITLLINTDGTLVSSNIYTSIFGNGSIVPFDVIQKENNNIQVFCSTSGQTGFLSVVQMDGMGNVVQEQQVERTTTSNSIIHGSSHTSEGYNFVNQNKWFWRTNQSGQLIYERRIASNSNYFLRACPTADNGFIIVGGKFNRLFVSKTDSLGNVYSNHLRGNLSKDLNANCIPDSEDLPFSNQLIQASNETQTFYTTTDSLGNYDLNLDTGIYQIHLPLDDQLWQSCQPNLTVQFPEFNTNDTIDFSIFPKAICPKLTLDISTNFLRRCFENQYTVSYCNEGSEAAEDVYIEVQLEDFLIFNGASVPLAAQTNNLYSFDIGSLDIGECSSFTLDVTVSCEAVLGQTHCVEAHIFPDSLCGVASPLWSGADLVLEAFCANDSLYFQIQNQGEGDMEELQQFIIIVDDVVLLQEDYQLDAGDSLQKSFPANDATWRMETIQVAHHPNRGKLVAMLEGCASYNENTSLGFILPFSQDNPSPAIATDCQENRGAYDPNDKQVLPTGIGEAHFIEPEQDLEYLIRFQNTGTDTAFQVVIRDTLSSWLEVSSLKLGTSSHPYTWEVFDEGMLKITFDDIMLPDSNVNEAASHGFVQFFIEQKPDVPLGTIIENRAAIYFDFNAPIITNTVQQEVNLDFLPFDTLPISISGFIFKPDSTPVENVVVEIPNVASQLTAADGSYRFDSLSKEETYQIIPQKRSTEHPNLSVLDIVKNRLLVNAVHSFESPYQWIAALPNGSTDLTFAAVWATKIILGEVDSFLVHHSWRFVPTIQEFPQLFPFNAPIASDIKVENPVSDVENQDFIALEMGDIITEPDYLPPNAPQTTFSFRPSMDTIHTSAFYVDIVANDFRNIMGWQSTVLWPNNLVKLMDIEVIGLDDGWDNFFSYNSALSGDGKLPFLWFPNSLNAVSLANDTALLRLHFTLIQPTTEQLEFSFAPQPTPSQLVFVQNQWDSLFVIEANYFNLELPVDIMTSVSSPNMEQNIKLFPNPTEDFIYVQTDFEQAEYGQWRLKNALGQIVKIGHFEGRKMNEKIRVKGFVKGIYWMEIEVGMTTVVKKVIVN